MSADPDSIIVLRLPRPQKGRYVAAARAQGLTLAAWLLAVADRAAPELPAATPPTPPPDEKPRTP